MTTRLLQIIALLGTIAVACTADNRVGHTSPPSDGGTVCRGTGLPPNCPATWEAAQTSVDCFSTSDLVVLGHSGDLVGRWVTSGAQTTYCLYDPATSALVGGVRTSDIADFCNETSHEIYYGVVEPDREYLGDIPGGPKCPGVGKCRAPLGESTCAPTWQEALVSPVLCRLPPGLVLFGHAGGFLTVNFGGGYAVDSCFYDPVTFALAGEWRGSDIAIYCDGTSFDIVYGDAVIRGMPFTNDLGAPSCPDAGATP
jgi:hypothetical protein